MPACAILRELPYSFSFWDLKSPRSFWSFTLPRLVGWIASGKKLQDGIRPKRWGLCQRLLCQAHVNLSIFAPPLSGTTLPAMGLAPYLLFQKDTNIYYIYIYFFYLYICIYIYIYRYRYIELVESDVYLAKISPVISGYSELHPCIQQVWGVHGGVWPMVKPGSSSTW